MLINHPFEFLHTMFRLGTYRNNLSNTFKSRLFGISSRSMTSKPLTNDYTTWSREELLNKIHQLEGNDSKKPKLMTTESHIDNLKPNKVQKQKKEFDFTKYTKRQIALKFAYFGWNYQGLALQGEETDLPTVEEKIMEALFKVKLIGSLEQDDCDFSRCGRTDKGVSAMNQVISLTVRSKLTQEELLDESNDIKEIDYIKTLNQSLPEDIRVHGVCLRPPQGFDARFSCTFRHYKYIFNGKDIDIESMNKAASYFLGENDFRNFCKVDASKQIVNFKRTILMSQIDKLPHGENLYVFNLKGTAFLWHQVRCMVGVLLTVGQKLEKPEIIQQLLDMTVYPSRPVYKMAHDIPLVLYDCGFDDSKVKWSTGPERSFDTNAVTNGLLNDYTIKAVIATFMRSFTDSSYCDPLGKINVNLGDGLGQAMKTYIPYEKRTRLETADQINAKWKGKKNEKKRTHSNVE